MLNAIIKKCKENEVEPWDIEMIYNMDNSDLQDGKLLTNEEYQEITSSTEKELKQRIFTIYYNNQVPNLPENIKNLTNQALKETTYHGWGLTLDWLEGVHDYNFDLEMSNYVNISNYFGERENAKKVYGYILEKEI